MTSSVLDGAGCESPAPPAFSPLTDPADPGNREPSEGVPINAEATIDDASRSHSQQQNDGTTATVNGIDSHLPSATDLTQHSRHDHSHSRPQTARDPAVPATPATPARPHLNTALMNNTMDLDMPMNSGMDYTASPALDLYSPYAAQQSSQLLMALARISAAQSQSQMIVHPPSTVRPSQVSLPPQSILDAANNLVPATPHAPNAVPHVDAPLESFARIEFADSVFQMTTYAVVIGRDQRALDQARRDERRHDDYERKKREHEERGLPAPLPPIQDRGKFSKSYVSEEGGMLGPESDGDDNPRPAKRRKTSGGVGSASGDSQRVEPAAGELAGVEDKNPINRQYVSHTPGAAAVNLSALRPSPHYVPFIGIHSPGPNIASRTKAISREHLKIKFNKADGVFEAIPLHKNGFFCEDVHYKEEKVVLKSGDHLQIKDVDFVFVINGVPHGKTGAEDGLLEEDGVSSRRYSEGGKEMSFDFESTHDPARRSTSPEETPAVEAPREDSDSELSEPVEDDPEPEPEEAAEQEVMETIEKDPDLSATVKPEMPLELLASLEPIVPKKRGPGRPPKNGIMSKREERLRKKAAMEIAKKNMPQPPPGEPPIKRKVGRPRKHPLPENAPDRPEKRKYKPRKSKTGEEGEEGSDPEKTIKERRREKPKTPPLELDRNDYTEEQLQKPPKNYGMLIDEVLTAAPDGLTLKQIYKRIQMKYPFYYFTVDTKGWESSVRHNLIGNDAFKKNEETHLWSRVPGIDIDAGKKRTKATSPDHSTSMHTFGQHYSTSATPTPQMFHAETGLQQGYRAAPAPQRPGYAPGQAARGQHPQSQLGAQAVGGTTQQAPRQPYSIPGQVQGATPVAAYGNQTGAHPPQGSAQATAYSSPYASRPPPVATQPGGPTQGVARQGLPPNHSATAANGLPRAGPPPAQAAPPAGPRPTQPALNGSPLPFKPAVAPELVRHVTNFRATVTEQLKARTSASEAIALSVIHRGLGLASESMVPDQADLERIVFGVFESSRKNLGANQSLHPGLVQALGKFKIDMIKTLEPKMGKLNAERLILSAVDRVLGFTDRSTMPSTDADRKQLLEAENVLIGAIQRVVTEHQRTLASTASAAAPPPAPAPGPSSAASTTPSSGQMPTQGHAPAPSHAPTGAYSSTAPPHQGARPATSLPTTAAPGPARPPAPAQSTSTAQPATVASTQQVPRPATVSALAAQTPAASTAQTRPQAPVSGPAQGSVQTPGQYSAPATAASTRNPALSGAAQTSAASATQPQSPAHALAQARAQAAAQNAQAQKPAQVPGPASSPATATNQTAGQAAPPAASTYPSAPKGPALASAPTVSQPQNQQALPPKLQGSAPGAASAPQRLGHSAPAPGMAPPAVTPAQTTTTAAVSAPAQPQLSTAPAVPAQRPAQAAPVAATPATVSQGSSSLPAPIQRPAQPVTANSTLAATAQNRVASSSPGTSHTMSQSPTPPMASNPPTPAQPSSQDAQVAAPVPSASPPLPAQPPAPPAPMANMTAATTPTPASAPPPTPPAATVTAAR
ncbi:hypothetical protein CHGG_00635 [Chaetomium globosum CBS 148.51]|uniref:Fork-head domain-containing protein n=1 Tax=Chaetomium globosum (strain ATCC 6205 / CBS 148.51 / DSM 1962 / NBRC 6347 / NRRL 1970) TaxID=306901 RepID=Q2HGL9_CHAGB|nr:uncharacterized protein CHGG_00635 [Chaetomium globosum CBS 148.51]EAQ92400.1 hypothetical protein CHGG_00635 [Chaetomium globosum CBS 148.51]